MIGKKNNERTVNIHIFFPDYHFQIPFVRFCMLFESPWSPVSEMCFLYRKVAV